MYNYNSCNNPIGSETKSFLVKSNDSNFRVLLNISESSEVIRLFDKF